MPRKQHNLNLLRSTCARSLNLSGSELISMQKFRDDCDLLAVITPAVDNLDLMQWAANNQSYLETALLKYGALLFRGFGPVTVDSFRNFVFAFTPNILDYEDQHTPRSRVEGNIYTSTEYPSDHHIPFHSENSKDCCWPLRIWFSCLKDDFTGGETPIADNRRVFQRLSAATKAHFIEKRVKYVRNCGGSLGLSWQQIFQTDSAAEVVERCKRLNIVCEWVGNEYVRLTHVAQAIAMHPLTNEIVWYNQAHLFHPSSLGSELHALLTNSAHPSDLPSYAYFGDGSEISVSMLEEIRAAYQKESIQFSWQKGDILMLDNMLVAHSRQPYKGTREIVVAMADTYPPLREQ